MSGRCVNTHNVFRLKVGWFLFLFICNIWFCLWIKKSDVSDPPSSSWL